MVHQLALARRLRPRTFQTVVGQEVTLQALSNALQTGRLHHAYLFTGTRGIGKTTLARIFAKCLNCEKGISHTPCGQCDTCNAIDEGRCLDVLEVDAASRTKVEDTRELLENVQYLPTQARFKIYLIDEVHMLSMHSFNALLKTLEEPPPHVKFLFATTDPQKLPVTVLSRCLQFHLHRLPCEQIVKYLGEVAEQEQITFELEALKDLGRAAEGSLRDALSLFEQAISYGNSNLTTPVVKKMLGLTESKRLITLLQAISIGNAAEVLAVINTLADYVPDFSSVLSDLLVILRHISILQVAPEALESSVSEYELLLMLAKTLIPEEVQLYYQIGILGQKELPYAPTMRIGFELVILRMLAFQPCKVITAHMPINFKEQPGIQIQIEEPKEIKPVEKTDVSHAQNQPQQNTHSVTAIHLSPLDWSELVLKLELSGITKQLAQHCTLGEHDGNFIHLILEESQKPLLQKRHEEKLEQAISQHFGRTFKLKITASKMPTGAQTPADQYQQQQEISYKTARNLMETDDNLNNLISTFSGKVGQIEIEKN